MSENRVQQLRNEVDKVNLELLELISHRAKLVQEIGFEKTKQTTKRFDPVREREMLNEIVAANPGPFEDSTVEHIFKEIFKAGLELQKDDHRKALLVSRKRKSEDTVIDIKGVKFGGGNIHHVFGPCAVESYEQVAAVAKAVKARGGKLLRGGAFKPRTSP